MKALSVEDFRQLAEQGAFVVDTRNVAELPQGFIKGSFAFGSAEKFGQLGRVFLAGIDLKPGVDNHPPVLLIGDESGLDGWSRAIQSLGFTLKGYLAGGLQAWQDQGGELDMIIDVEADELIMDIPFDDNLVVMDLRPAIVFGGGHLKDAINLPLENIADPLRLSAIEDNDNLYLLGNSDEDNFLAATVLKRQGIHNLRVVTGGWPAVEKENKAEIVKDPGLLN